MGLRIRRYVRINARGRELNKFLNTMHIRNIECRGQYCRSGTLYGDFLRRDMEKIRCAADECGIELKTAYYDSVLERLSRYRHRVGLLIGTCLALFTALYFSQVIVTVEIHGNSAVRDDIILAALEELGIKSGAHLSKVDLHSCESRLPFMVEGIAWAGMHRTGSRVVVQIREEAAKPQKVSGRIPCNIISNRDAEITSVLVRCGTLMHIIGDYVPKGTLLISGVTEYESKRVEVLHAMGEIRGVYNDNVSFSAAFRSEEYSPTGRSDTQRTLRLFSLDIPLYFNRNKYIKSLSSCSEKPLILFGKELPVSLRCRVIEETACTERVRTAEELKEKLMERVYLYEKNFLGDDIRIISRRIVSSETEDSLTLSVSYMLEGNIGEQREIFIK